MIRSRSKWNRISTVAVSTKGNAIATTKKPATVRLIVRESSLRGKKCPDAGHINEPLSKIAANTMDHDAIMQLSLDLEMAVKDLDTKSERC